MRLVFMGTPDFALPTLKALLAAKHDIAAVYTQPPRPAGRGMTERRSPVHELALAHSLVVRTPKSLKSAEEQSASAALAVDVAIVVAYGLILPEAVLSAPKQGCFNVHASLLPRWRGAAPIQRAIMAGDEETGVTIMRMAAGLDAGPVCLTGRVSIPPDMTAGTLHDELAERGARLMVEALRRLEAGSLVCTPQPDVGVTYANKISNAETHIDFTRPATEVRNHVHGLSPYPGAWFELPRDGKTFRIKALHCTVVEGEGAPGTALDSTLTVACGTGSIRMLTVQREGKSAQDAAAFLRGLAVAPGTRLA
jgi:methionyl-tRNA formyltransferase